MENTTLRLLQQNHCNYCHDIALKYFTMKTPLHHLDHYTCVPLETATASLSIGINPAVDFKLLVEI